MQNVCLDIIFEYKYWKFDEFVINQIVFAKFTKSILEYHSFLIITSFLIWLANLIKVFKWLKIYLSILIQNWTTMMQYYSTLSLIYLSYKGI